MGVIEIPINLFVYDTLMQKGTLREVLGHLVPETHTTLSGWEVVQDENGYRTIVPSPGAWVKGEILKVSSVDLSKLDEWESRYSRAEVRTDDGRWCFTYVLKNYNEVKRAPELARSP
jgi:gamma-glutamylcyclotransferase (GGCT)/AIG2-like uncharacterized protein YtfP